ncbi:hypothetical protein I2483_13680 [Sporosarcina sp. E16_3]|uniref:hypothetical protein n=1 Tax=Sporosarcina sp. E16_3 TaxID=2789293 RepID=UPI001A91EB1B|nr:hypothetical protein [Sporosarcina sp. E16_3]MBO0602713.1 hypothetical protein [Sporosarcina sp. E16_3]
MHNELLVTATRLLEAVNPTDVETVQINHTKYDDGSTGFTIDITYPAKVDIT